ncbi:MAG: putative phosphodiesterase, partial [Candidatus Paceibacteria bacterium]
ASQGFALSKATLPAAALGESSFAPLEHGAGLVLNSTDDVLILAERIADLETPLPRSAISLSAWVAVERPDRWGGILSCVQDNAGAELGFVLGYQNEFCSFGLSTSGADDGDGMLTYLRGVTPMASGRWHHVAATFDGKTTRLYLDGQLEVESTEQFGKLLYDQESPFVFGAYRDKDENFPMDGRLLAGRLSTDAWTAADVLEQFDARRELTELPPWTDMVFEFLVEPYLTWPRADGVSVLFETTNSSTAEIHYRTDDADPSEVKVLRLLEAERLHECKLDGLQPDQKYFYQVFVEAPNKEQIGSPLLSFRTAASQDKAYTFVVIGDTQTNGDVAKRVSDLAWMHRPNFAVHAGDLVDTGSNKRDWTDVFFPSMQPLIGRVPLMPVLGNHEQDAALYYDYMSLPEPERWYSFTYGNADFFMIDGNRSLADRSAQLDWLESALSGSEATWKFAVLHQPPYTSDSNDYGDTNVGGSFRGDKNVRNIVRLLEKHGVDICFSGHVHDYERTFPIRDGQVTAYEDGGVIYVTAAGGGGPLEDFDPANTWFGHKKARYHHLVYVAIHGKHLEFQAIDEEGRLFDVLTLRKRE